ncbi:hypothetical protein R6Q57_018461, partial [Mikania cordata]
MANLTFRDKHNLCAYLDPATKNGKEFRPMIEFLRRSRIYHVISNSCQIYRSHIQSFWDSASLITVDDDYPPVIRGKVQGHDIIVSVEHIKRICGFQDAPDHPILLDHYLVRGCFMRCKYDRDLEARVLNKAYLSPQFKYLAHVLIHCLGSRRGGFDELRETIQCAFVAL